MTNAGYDVQKNYLETCMLFYILWFYTSIIKNTIITLEIKKIQNNLNNTKEYTEMKEIQIQQQT